MHEPEIRGIDLSLEPLDDYVVIQPSDEESETNLGLIIPASTETDCRTGVVTAVGSDAGGVEPGTRCCFRPTRVTKCASVAPRSRSCGGVTSLHVSTTDVVG